MKTTYQICWKHKDFSNSSEGPILRHSEFGVNQLGDFYTKLEAEETCRKFNLNVETYKMKNTEDKIIKLPVVKHWVEEVLS